MLKEGFYCALGTPLDNQGNLIEESLKNHIESQINAGASGLLLMGSMGCMGCIRENQYEKIVQTAVDATASRVTLMVGAQDNSIARMKDRLDILGKYDVSVVVTAPYYFSLTRATAMTQLRAAAELTTHDVYIYDHPYTARYKIQYEDMLELSKYENVKGIKTGDAILIKTLNDNKHEFPADFTPIFSNSDLFTMGHAYGIKHILDGIFASFPATIARAQSAFNAGDFEGGKKALNELMDGRNVMIDNGLWPCFSYAMNLLGFEGMFGPDYEPNITEEAKAITKQMMIDIGEIRG